MSDSVGRVALGIVGALILAPFGMAGLGFSLGMAVGGMIFAPDGPQIEGPRIGDTSVTSASLGKTIPQHYAVTRSAGNVIWSAGLKEVKTTETQGGKGGGGAETTTYTYYCSFAIAYGRAPARNLRRIWADGKLIYDANGFGATQNAKYRLRFIPGGDGTEVDPLIAESINRRLQGRPDVNEGNQEQSTYTTYNDLIAQADADGSPRGQLYASKLREYLSTQGIDQGSDATQDYRFTPSFKELTYIVFDNMPLEDFGNRIPNLTAEIEWDFAALQNVPQVPRIQPMVHVTDGVPKGLAGIDTVNTLLVTSNDGTLRRLTLDSLSEDRAKLIKEETFGVTMDRVLASNNLAEAVAVGTKKNSLLGSGQNAFHFVSPSIPSVMSSVIWPHLGAAGLTDVYAQRFPVQWWSDSNPDKSAASGYVAVTNTKAALLTNKAGAIVVSETDLAAISGISKVGPIGVPYRQNEQPKVIGLRFGDRSFALQKYYLDDAGVPDHGIVAGTVQEGHGYSFKRITSKVHVVVTPPEFASGPTITDVSAFYYDQFVLPFELKGGLYGTFYDLVSMLLPDNPDVAPFRVLFRMSDGTGRIRTVKGEYKTIPIPPKGMSGLAQSIRFGSFVLYGSGKNLVRLNVDTGSYTTYEVFTTGASDQAQIFLGNMNALLTWDGAEPVFAYLGRGELGVVGTQSLAGIIEDICLRSGMDYDEFDVSGIGINNNVSGYSVARPSTARAVLESLLMAYFVDGVERDWQVEFKDRTTTPIRTIDEDELGAIDGGTGEVNFAESRSPEHELPAEVNINFIDPLRDFEQNTVQKRRIANPVASMESAKIANVEIPIVMQERTARAIAERMLFLQWMARDRSKMRFNWGQIDLDPGDVVSVKFRDGRVLTDRIGKVVTGANLELEVEGVRSSDPVYVPTVGAQIVSGAVPSQSIAIPVSSSMFVFDIPLLEDFHEASGGASLYYMAVGARSAKWRSASVYRSADAADFSAIASFAVDITWGDVAFPLPAPRALWSTDRENTVTVYPALNKGDLVSVSREEILGGANRALIWNPSTGIGEVIQFQLATVQADGSVVLSELQRGLRGTDYAVDKHIDGSLFFLLKDATIKSTSQDVGRIGTQAYFKAVSAGQLVNAVASTEVRFHGRDITPWAPSRVRRSDNGSDLTLTWNRRARIGGQWNFTTGEAVPLIEEFEQYEVYLLPSTANAVSLFNPDDPATYGMKQVVSTPSFVFTSADLATAGVSLSDDINVAIYQTSTRVGRGFPRFETLAP